MSKNWISTLVTEKNYKNEEGKIKPEFEKYILRTLMKNCVDFLEEESAMEVLLSTLSLKQQGRPSIQLLTSPKFYCELAVKESNSAGVSRSDSIAISKSKRRRRRRISRRV